MDCQRKLCFKNVEKNYIFKQAHYDSLLEKKPRDYPTKIHDDIAPAHSTASDEDIASWKMSCILNIQ